MLMRRYYRHKNRRKQCHAPEIIMYI